MGRRKDQFNWTPELVDSLRRLIDLGYDAATVARLFSLEQQKQISVTNTYRQISRHNIPIRKGPKRLFELLDIQEEGKVFYSVKAAQHNTTAVLLLKRVVALLSSPNEPNLLDNLLDDLPDE